MTLEPKDLLLLVWVHGFKGNDVTFEAFPDRVCHLLRETHPTLRIESQVFPAYQTRGELHAATLAFVDWLTNLVVQLEVDHGAGGGAGKAKVVLVGHSMGGLLIADAARDIVANTRAGDSMWPRIVALLAFDTPYLGLHPHVFKHGISTAASYYDSARTVASNLAFLSPVALGLGLGKFGSSSSSPSSDSAEAGPSRSSRNAPSSALKSSTPPPPPSAQAPKSSNSSWLTSIPTPSAKALYGLGAVALGAAAVGTAYYRRDDFLQGWKWGYEHMTFVGNLWDQEAMKARLDAVAELDKTHNIRFRNFYTHLPPSPPAHLLARTFTILPPLSHATYPLWTAASNGLASDEVNAHMYMFNGKTNDGYYALGLAMVRVVGERIEEEGVRRSGLSDEQVQGAEKDEESGQETIDVLDQRTKGDVPVVVGYSAVEAAGSKRSNLDERLKAAVGRQTAASNGQVVKELEGEKAAWAS